MLKFGIDGKWCNGAWAGRLIFGYNMEVMVCMAQRFIPACVAGEQGVPATG
jgi:hypothetical protein